MIVRDLTRAALFVASLAVCTACGTGEASNGETTEESDLFPGAPDESDAILHASGFEPGWTLDIFEDRMVYVGRYGEERVVTPPPEPLPPVDTEAERAERTYVAHTDTYDFQVRVVEEPCTPPSGKAPLPLTVHLTIDGQEYTGCGTRS